MDETKKRRSGILILSGQGRAAENDSLTDSVYFLTGSSYSTRL